MQGAGRSPLEGRWVSHLERVVTLEVALYLGAVVLGAILRLSLLDQRPLSIEEGTLASEAHRIAQGLPPDSLQQGPLTAYGTALMLAMFAGGDGAARLLTALFGSAMVGIPYLLRSSLGRIPALLAAFGIALSPLMLFGSRGVGGGTVPVVFGLLLWWTLAPGLKGLEKSRAYAAALLLAGLLASGTEGITVLVTLGAAALLSDPRPYLLIADLRRTASSPTGKEAALAFVGGLLLLGTGLGSHLQGVQSVVVDVWARWLGSFSLSAPRGGLLLLLALYEFPVLVLALAQLGRTLFRRDRVDSFLSLWAMLLLLLGMVQDSASASRLVLPALPLYLLAARLVSDSLPLMRGVGWNWRWAVASASVAVPFAVAVVLLNRATLPGMMIEPVYLYVELALVLVTGLAVGFLLERRDRMALAWLAVALLSAGYLTHSAAFLNYRMETVSREPLVGNQISPFLRDAVLSSAYYSAYYRTPLSVDPSLKASLAWYLRGAGDVQYTTEVSQGISFRLVQRGQESLETGSERRPGLYAPAIDPRDLSWQGVWRWVVSRDSLVRANQRDIIVRAPAGNW